MKRIKVNSKVEQGKCVTNKKLINKAFGEFEGKEIVITIERKVRKRSNDQNAYYWGVVVPMIMERLRDLGQKMSKAETDNYIHEFAAGLDKTQVHEMLKYKFAAEEIVDEKTGEICRIPKSTTKMSTSDHMEFIAEIQAWALDMFDIEIPSPNEQAEIQFEV